MDFRHRIGDDPHDDDRPRETRLAITRERRLTDAYSDSTDDIFGRHRDTPGHGRRGMGLDSRCGDTTARALITGFDASRANRTDLTNDEAMTHLRNRVREQPKLLPVLDQEPCVRRVYAIVDQGRFHGAERHEGGVSNADHERRVLLREDPAQTNPDKRAQGVDGYKKGKHLCGEHSTGISDPVAYLVALVRGTEHPEVRAGLASQRSIRPDPIRVPIRDLLGEDGHEWCRGYELVGDPGRAKADRNAWLKARWSGQDHGVTPPRAAPISTFRGGTIEFRFGHATGGGGYELTSMFPIPAPRPDQTDTKR